MTEGDIAALPRVDPRVDPRVVLGARSVGRALRRPDPLAALVVSGDAPEDVVAPLRRLAALRAIPVRTVPTSAELGASLGLPRPVLVAAERP
jgi:ribosomal protein L7Ae-like RNA K-turn-binding protein